MPMLKPTEAGSTFYGRGGGYIKSIPTELPAAEMSPESLFEQQITSGRQQIQQRFELQWNEINRRARTLGRVKHNKMLSDLLSKSKMEMLEFNQRAQSRMSQIRNIDRYDKSGMINNADEIKTRLVAGDEVANAMFPKERSLEQQYGQLAVHRNRIEDMLSQFRMGKERIPSALLRAKAEPLRLGKGEVWDRSIISVDPKTKKETMGAWREAAPEEMAERTMLIRELDRVERAQSELLSGRDVRQRIRRREGDKGTFESNVTASLPGGPSGKQLTRDVATRILQEVGGDRELARQLARQRGYTF